MDFNWESAGVGAVTTGFLVALGTALTLWKKWRRDQQDLARGDIDLVDKARRSDADFKALEDDRLIKKYEALILRIESEHEELMAENNKRNREHLECQKENAALRKDIEHLTRALLDKSEQIRELRMRIETLEKRNGP